MIKRVTTVSYQSDVTGIKYDTPLEARQAEIVSKLTAAFSKAMGFDGMMGCSFSVQEILGLMLKNEDAIRAVFRNPKLNKNVVFKAYKETQELPQEKTILEKTIEHGFVASWQK